MEAITIAVGSLHHSIMHWLPLRRHNLLSHCVDLRPAGRKGRGRLKEAAISSISKVRPNPSFNNARSTDYDNNVPSFLFFFSLPVCDNSY